MTLLTYEGHPKVSGLTTKQTQYKYIRPKSVLAGVLTHGVQCSLVSRCIWYERETGENKDRQLRPTEKRLSQVTVLLRRQFCSSCKLSFYRSGDE